MNKRRFSFTSPKFVGEVIFEFNNDVLSFFDMGEATLDEEQHVYLVKHLPRELAEVQEWLKKSKGVFTEIIEDVSFDEFWKRYFEFRKVDNSSKKRARMKWDKMSKADRSKAYRYIPRYLRSIPSGTNPKHVETYLNAELWNN